MDLSQLQLRPRPDEYAAYYDTYISLVSADCYAELCSQATELPQFFETLTEEQGSLIHPPYTWTIGHVLAHMVDTERVFAARLHHIAAGDSQPLPNMDQNLYAAVFDSSRTSIANLAEEFKFCRLANILLARRVAPGAWDNHAIAAGNSVTARALAWMLVGHVTYHMKILRARLGR